MKIRKSQIVFDILAAASFVGAHYILVFAKKKLGFVRWLNFNGTKITQAIPVDSLRMIAAAIILLLALFALYTVLKRRSEAGINGLAMLAVMIIASMYTIYATIKFDYEYSQAYFLILPVLWAGTVCLVIRSLIPAAKKGSQGKTE